MTTEQLQYLKKALAFVFSLVEPDEYFGKCPEADYEAINGLIEGEIERQNVTDEERRMIKQYEDELKELKIKMAGAEKFAEKIPVFRQFILDKKLNGTEDSVRFADGYKDIRFHWGLHRARFKSGTSRTITSYKGDYDKHLFMVYINTLSLYDSHEKFGLEKVLEKSTVFFFDKMNTTFYVADEHIEGFLEALNDWYVGAIAKVEQYKKGEEIRELEERLARLKEEEWATGIR